MWRPVIVSLTGSPLRKGENHVRIFSSNGPEPTAASAAAASLPHFPVGFPPLPKRVVLSSRSQLALESGERLRRSVRIRLLQHSFSLTEVMSSNQSSQLILRRRGSVDFHRSDTRQRSSAW